MEGAHWYVTLAIIASALASLGIVWRVAIHPTLSAIWAAIKAAPQIPIILDDLREILRSDVLNKLEGIQMAATRLEERTGSHEKRLDDHETRITKIEKWKGSDTP